MTHQVRLLVVCNFIHHSLYILGQKDKTSTYYKRIHYGSKQWESSPPIVLESCSRAQTDWTVI